MLWLILPAVLIGTVLQRISGTGVGLVVAPVFALLLGGAEGVFLTNATTAISGFLLTLALWRVVDWRRWAALCACAVIGTVPGALIVRSVPGPVLQLVVGLVVLGAMAVTLSGCRTGERSGPLVTAGSGAAGGLLNVTAGVAAPAMVIYSRITRWPQAQYAATMQPVFMTLGLMSLTAKALVGASPHASLPTPWLIPGAALSVLVGLPAGTALARRMAS